MAALITPVSVECRFAPYIEELREFFATSGLHYGSGEDIFPLAERLQTPGPFSDDLGSLVRSIILRQGGSVPHGQLLDIVAFAIGGSEIEQQLQHFQEPLRHLLAFVSAVVRRPWNMPPGPDAPGPQLVAESATEPEQAASQMPASDDSTEFSSALGIALAANAATAGRRTSSPDHPVPPAPHSPTPDPVPASPVSPPLRFSARLIALACLIPAVLLLALYLHLHPRTSGTTVIQSGSQPVATSSGLVAPSKPKPTPDGPSVAIPLSPIHQLQTQPTASPHAERHTHSASPTPDGNRPQTTLQQTLPANAPAQTDSEIVPDTQPSFAPDTSASVSPGGEALTTRPRTPTSLYPTRRSVFDVSSGVMASHVISAPDPEYPTLARLAHIQGQVILQAVISPDGEVAAVHVLSGHRLLRGAAVKAVRRWRYRPYIADGHPITIATIVTIDFSARH